MVTHETAALALMPGAAMSLTTAITGICSLIASTASVSPSKLTAPSARTSASCAQSVIWAIWRPRLG